MITLCLKIVLRQSVLRLQAKKYRSRTAPVCYFNVFCCY